MATASPTSCISSTNQLQGTPFRKLLHPSLDQLHQLHQLHEVLGASQPGSVQLAVRCQPNLLLPPRQPTWDRCCAGTWVRAEAEKHASINVRIVHWILDTAALSSQRSSGQQEPRLSSRTHCSRDIPRSPARPPFW